MAHPPLADSVTIRAEQPADEVAIAAIVEAAFGSPVEARLVEAIRRSPEYVRDWALVAEADGGIVGHVMVSYAALHDDGAVSRIPMLSPLAVAPPAQGGGVGSALVRAVVRLVDDSGEPCIVLEGSPPYYGRFGFEPAAAAGLHIPVPSWAPPEAGQVLRLTCYDATRRGRVAYPAAFDAVTEE